MRPTSSSVTPVRDRERVLPIIDRLEAAGVKTWIDRDGIHGGANYALEIAEAIEHAAAMLVMCSPASLSSRNVKQEIALGWRFDRPYLPLLLETVEIPKDVAYWLEASQWVEVLDHKEHEWLPTVRTALEKYGVNPEAAKPTALRSRPFLVGREREQATLREQLERMLAGHGGTVLVGGEAGIGKTTLIEDLSIEAEDRGTLVLWGHAYDLSVTPPYGPWLEIFRQYRSVSDSLPPLPAFIGNPDELAKVGSQQTLFTSVADFFQSVAAQHPLVLVLDDLHWADEASLDFFRFLARQLSNQRLQLIATYRTDELHRRHPLYSLLPLFVREAEAERLEVRRLDDAGHRALIRGRYELSETDQTRLETYLVAHAEGNPFYAGELLRTLEDAGILAHDGQRWLMGDLEQVRLPPLVRQVIDGRLSRLDVETRELLQLASVIGQELPFDLWRWVSEKSDPAIAAAIAQGQAAHVIEESTSGVNYRFVHALIREALYQEVIAPRRRTWHGQIAEALLERSAPDPDLVAEHFRMAGDSRAVDWLLKAADRAERAYSWVMAAQRLEAALPLLDADSTREQDRGWALYRIANLLRFADVNASEAYLHEAEIIANRIADRALQAQVAFGMGVVHSFRLEMRSGIPEMEKGVERFAALNDEEKDTARKYGFGIEVGGVILNEGMFLLHLAHFGRPLETIARGEPYVEKLKRAEPLLMNQQNTRWMDAWLGLGEAYAVRGDRRRARAAMRRARQTFVAVEDYMMTAATFLWELWWLVMRYEADRVDERVELARQATDFISRASPATSWDELNTNAWMPVHLVDGRWPDAERVATLALDSFGTPAAAAAPAIIATIARYRGNRKRVEEMIQLGLPEGPMSALGAHHPGHFGHSIELQLVAVLDALDVGDLDYAAAWLRAIDEGLEESGFIWGGADASILRALYSHASGNHAQARQHADQALELASDPRQPLALIAIHRFLGMLDTEEEQFDAAETNLQKSLSLADACAAPFERALTLLEIAKLRLAQGNPGEARLLLAEVRSICEPLGAKPTLERVAALDRQLGAGASDPS